MATTKPRILVTLEPEVYDVLKKLSRHNKKSMSEIVRDVVDLVHEPYARLNALWDEVEQKKHEITVSDGDVSRAIREIHERYSEEAHIIAGIAKSENLRQLDFYDQLVTAVGLAGGDAAGEPPPSPAVGPPPTNRGVRSQRSGSNGLSAARPAPASKKPRKGSSNG